MCTDKQFSDTFQSIAKGGKRRGRDKKIMAFGASSSSPVIQYPINKVQVIEAYACYTDIIRFD